MNWKEFIATIIDSLAWPAVVIVAFFVFKERLGAVLAKLAKVKYKDLELDFEKLREQAKEIESKEPEVNPSEGPSNPTLSSLEDQILNSVESAPSAAILLAWSAVEASLASAVARLAISPESPSYRSPLHNIEVLHKHSGIQKMEIQLLHEMRMLRNKVSHEHETLKRISSEQAEDYTSTAFKLIKILNSLDRKD
ncbi:hypothetical protein DDZ13_14975 [Coraliomargarita sinensis]|uniref:DUF4145 domain-containing protein n=1 Tax=Coraliomargarita sinensis TaxID=2174842 RepID=A0A317ZCI5_9BACT|nr:hypothetical protein [Coraliomargarita sinensis]PXA02855.1 hypothetical protein DDZ13_14975 [Coraliomargarita sinensis]